MDSEFSRLEMNDTLVKMKNGVAGPDQITPEMLKNLHEEGKIKMLSIINRTSS